MGDGRNEDRIEDRIETSADLDDIEYKGTAVDDTNPIALSELISPQKPTPDRKP